MQLSLSRNSLRSIEQWTGEPPYTAVFGPGLCCGITAGDWFRLLRANQFAVHPRRAPRCLSITAGSLATSMHVRGEVREYGADFLQATIQPPLFVLGHWRSGTTHLQNLLSRDDRFAFPNMYQAFYPNTFLKTEAIDATRLSFVMPRTRPMDNMKCGMGVPGEDEVAIAIMSGLSHHMT